MCLCLSAFALRGRAQAQARKTLLEADKAEAPVPGTLWFSVFGSSPESPGRRGHSLGGGTFPRKASFCISPGRAVCTHPGSETPRTRGCALHFRCAGHDFLPSCANCEVPSPPLALWGWAEGGSLRGRGGRPAAGRSGHSRRCLSVTVVAGAPDPDKRPPARSALLPFTFPKPILGSFNTLKWPAKLSRAQIHPHGEDVRIFFFLTHCWNVNGAVSLEAPQESGGGSLRSRVFLESSLSRIGSQLVDPEPATGGLRAHVALRNLMPPQGGLSWGSARSWSPRSSRQAQGT